MKTKSVKRFTAVVLCLFLVFMTGCVNNTPVDTHTDSTTSTTTTTTTTATTSSTDGTSTTAVSAESEKDTTVTTTTTKTSTKPTTTTTRDPHEYDPSIEKLVALTFDDGPYAPVTDRILDTLEKYGAKATFFVVGNRIDNYQSTVKRASRLGCEIASHTWSHKNLTKLTAQEISNEIGKSTIKIASVTGKPVTLVRPPEGARNDLVKQTVKYPLIMWSVDSMDWKNRNAKKNYNAVTSNVFDGSIVLMHDLYPETAAAVEKIVPDLIARGYKFVTVTELMEARGVQMKDGKSYRQARP